MSQDLEGRGKDERAALIFMATVGDAARAVLIECSEASRSVQLIEREVRRRFPNPGKPESESTSPPETPESPVAEPESSEPVSEQTTKTTPLSRTPGRGGRQHPLANHPDGPVILAHCLASNARTV